MNYTDVVEGIFIQRINRFIATVKINDTIETVHVKNTGRCKELFIEGTRVYLEKSKNPNRKTAFSLISIYKGDRLINIDSQVPNQVVYEALSEGKIQEIGSVHFLKRECTYGDSRFDLYYETSTAKGYIEVKGVTLEQEGIAMFPDAPTSRGSKHIHGLTYGQEQGFKNYIFFLIQMKDVFSFRTNTKTDPAFASALIEAKNKGVIPLIYNCEVTPDSIVLDKKGYLYSI